MKTRKLHNTECGRESRSLSANKAPMLKINQGRRDGKPDAENQKSPPKNRNQQAYPMEVQMQVQLQDHEDHPLLPKTKNHTAGTDRHTMEILSQDAAPFPPQFSLEKRPTATQQNPEATFGY